MRDVRRLSLPLSRRGGRTYARCHAARRAKLRAASRRTIRKDAISRDFTQGDLRNDAAICYDKARPPRGEVVFTRETRRAAIVRAPQPRKKARHAARSSHARPAVRRSPRTRDPPRGDFTQETGLREGPAPGQHVTRRPATRRGLRTPETRRAAISRKRSALQYMILHYIIYNIALYNIILQRGLGTRDPPCGDCASTAAAERADTIIAARRGRRAEAWPDMPSMSV